MQDASSEDRFLVDGLMLEDLVVDGVAGRHEVDLLADLVGDDSELAGMKVEILFRLGHSIGKVSDDLSNVEGHLDRGEQKYTCVRFESWETTDRVREKLWIGHRINKLLTSVNLKLMSVGHDSSDLKLIKHTVNNEKSFHWIKLLDWIKLLLFWLSSDNSGSLF